MSNIANVSARPVVHNASAEPVAETVVAEVAAEVVVSPAAERPSAAVLVAIGLGASAPKSEATSQTEKLMLLGAQFASRE